MANKVEVNQKVNPVKVPLETDQGILESEERKWGLPLREIYKHGLFFYKDKEGKAMHLSYEDRLKLVAYTQQAAHGPLDTSSAPQLGVLDVIGRDRRAAWQALGQMTSVQAMAGFIHLLDRLCPLFKPYIEAIQKDLENKKQLQIKKLEEEKARKELENRIELEKQKHESARLTEEQQVQRIKDALNAQTYEQFLKYARQQFPGNFDQQAVLIRQLQDQHYQQYVRQLAADGRLGRESACVQAPDEAEAGAEEAEAGAAEAEAAEAEAEAEAEAAEAEAEAEAEAARMWTRGDVAAFKASARAGGGTLTVGHGEAVTVRVPTHRAARCLCFEFATDGYDIGFGLFFEWSKSPTSEVTVHVADSEDDDADDDDDDDNESVVRDPELGPQPHAGAQRPPVSLVVPTYRRDCHTEVYAGSHAYPGEGVYLLKFDNTYSLWRSKTLYYKVYYTQ